MNMSVFYYQGEKGMEPMKDVIHVYKGEKDKE